MRKWHLVTIILVTIVIVVLGPRLIPPDSDPNEPVYKGQKLRTWVALKTLGAPTESREAAEAIRAIGWNAVPFLLQWIEDPPRSRKRKLFAKPISWSERALLASGSCRELI